MSNLDLIREIPYLKVGGREIRNNELEELIKNKLIDSECNTDILRLARGERRGVVIQNIINLPGLLFSWGEKAMCAYSDSALGEKRDRDKIVYAEPNNNDNKMLKSTISDVSNALDFHRLKYGLNLEKESDVENFKKKLNDIIDNTENHEKILDIKEYILYLLHTSGYRGKYKFSNVSPMISMSSGEERVSIAKKYAGARPGCHTVSGRSIIYDYWLPVDEEDRLYKKLERLRERLREDNLYWYKDRDSEVMVKYALFPQNIIGYYYFEGTKLKYYEVNPNYLEAIKNNVGFRIGDNVYIDQSNVDFERSEYKKIPFTYIYTYDGNTISVYSCLTDL